MHFCNKTKSSDKFKIVIYIVQFANTVNITNLDNANWLARKMVTDIYEECKEKNKYLMAANKNNHSKIQSKKSALVKTQT